MSDLNENEKKLLDEAKDAPRRGRPRKVETRDEQETVKKIEELDQPSSPSIDEPDKQHEDKKSETPRGSQPVQYDDGNDGWGETPVQMRG